MGASVPANIFKSGFQDMKFRFNSLVAIFFINNVHCLPIDEECTNQVLCYGMHMVFTDLSQGGDAILAGSGFDQQKDFIKKAIINLADKDLDGKVDFDEFQEKGVELLKMIFTLFDRDSDGVVDDDEATIDKISQKTVNTGVNMIFKIFDQNQDEHISTDDIPNNEVFDRDEDGEVTLNELLTTLSDEKITNTIFLPKPLQNLYNILDSNKDERTSREEVDSFINVLFKVFNVLDKDDDCFITKDEVLQVMGENEVRRDYQLSIDIITTQYIKLFHYLMTNFINESDSNGNKKLDFEEIIRFSDMKFLEDSLRTAVSLGNPNFSALYYIMGAPGGPDRFGRPNWADKNSAQQSLAIWLSFADGLLRDKDFFQENKCQ